ncbi:EEF1A lysine methyltransferase 3-like [Heterodontus francisci]|uniref:EEF1A lysine methyltransferase 3-like n=1 Tax=Heterodontus francisci TaxID=7792 RepID=UPI00355C5E65
MWGTLDEQARTSGTSTDPGQNRSSDQKGSIRNHEKFKGILQKMTSFQRQENSGNAAPSIEWLLPNPNICEKQFTFCGHLLNIARYFGGNLGFSASIWESAIVLCQYFEQEKINFSGRKVIELGSGTGIVGILAVLLGGDVTMTDQENVLSQIEHNVSTNIPSAARHRSKVCALSWGKDHIKFPTDYDFILGSDIVYTSLAYPLLLKTLLHLSDEPTIIYLASKLRKGNQSITFHEKLLPQHFNCQLVHRVEDKDINVYKIIKLNSTTRDDLLMYYRTGQEEAI